MWIRNSAPADVGERPRLLGRLRRLEADGFIEELSVNSWPRQVMRDPDYQLPGYEAEIRDRIAEFETWAEGRGHELEPAFQWCERSSIVTDHSSEVIVLPVMCLEVRSDEELLAVAPCRTAGETVSVSECVRQLETARETRDQQARPADSSLER